MPVTVAHGATIVSDGYCMTEGPRWWRGELYFADAWGKAVHALRPDGQARTVATFDEHVSGLGFLPDGDLLVSRIDSRTLARVTPDGRSTLYADLSSFADALTNDMAVDAIGRAYVTQFGPPQARGSTDYGYTRIITVEPDGSVHVGIEGLQGPNGIGIRPDGRTLVVCEATGERITALDIAPDGALSNPRTFAEVPGKCPDGMCLDAQGGVWAGIVLDRGPPYTPGPGFCRYDASGALTHLIPAEPGRYPVACCFGGEGRRTLYMCTTGHLEAKDARDARSSRIDSIEIEGFFGEGVP